MGRNVFESNMSEPSLAELTALDGKLYTILPPPEKGCRYEFTTLSNGEVAVIVEKS